MKRVAVQSDLVEVRTALEEKGYDVVSFSDEGHVDAIVYTNDYSGIQNFNNYDTDNEMGAVLVNAYNKEINEIEYIIEKRRYGSLFI